MRIHRLSEGTINRIAAGEVIERPARVVKELVENALDAGATQIDVAFRGGGKSFIRVTDNGSGMAPDDLSLCIERHATSKLSDGNLIDIRTLGFRGEALPSIASVSRMSLSSRLNGAGEANVLRIESGQRQDLKPASLAQGTEIEVRDLFYATPARLKFLKADRTETAEAADQRFVVGERAVLDAVDSSVDGVVDTAQRVAVGSDVLVVVARDLDCGLQLLQGELDGARVFGLRRQHRPRRHHLDQVGTVP